MTEKRIKGSEIPHLVDPQFYDMYFDQEEVDDMQAEYDTEYTPEQIQQFIEDWKKMADSLKGADVYSIDKNGEETLVMRGGEKVNKTPISLKLDASDLKAIKHIANEEGLPYQTLIGYIIHKVATRQIQLQVITK